MASCGGRSTSESYGMQDDSTDYYSDTVSQKTINKTEPSIIGTYSVKGPRNKEALIVKINDDNTVQMKYESSDHIFYGNWQKLSDNENSAWCHFKNDNYTTPTRRYEDFDATSRMWTFVIMDGYCYADYDAAKSKNPEQRIEAIRVDNSAMTNNSNNTASASDEVSVCDSVPSTTHREDVEPQK